MKLIYTLYSLLTFNTLNTSNTFNTFNTSNTSNTFKTSNTSNTFNTFNLTWVDMPLPPVRVGRGSIRPPPFKCHITCRIGLKFVVWPHVDCVWWISWSNKGQKGHIMCQNHVKSKIQFFLNFCVLKIRIVYLQFFRKPAWKAWGCKSCLTSLP